MERQNHRARRAVPRAGERADAFFLSSSGDRPDFHQEAVRRDGRDALPRLPPEYRLARERQSEPVLFLRGHRQGETPGTAGRRVREFQGRRGARHAIRYARALEPRAPCECGEGFHQLVSLARRPDRAAKIFSPELRRDGRFTAHRYSERRRKAGEPPRRWSQLSRRRRRDRMDGDEAGAGSFRRGARECGKTKKVIEPMIESSCPSAGIGFLGIGFLNDLFYGRSYSAGPAEAQTWHEHCLSTVERLSARF